jgi:ABC-type lipoprotein release transport system permease subunit
VQDVNGTLTAGAFRIAGLYHSPNSGYDERTVFVRKADLNGFLLADGISHEIVMLVDDYRKADAYAQRLRADTSVVVKSWGDLSPAMRYSEASLGTVLVIMMGIILLALTFGIVNTMLMAVLERTPELGMMKAIGIDNVRTAAMILFETVFLTLVGAPIGLLLSWGTIQLTAQTGIDLGAFASGLEMYGMSPVVIPELSAAYYAAITAMMMVATLGAALFPCLKALKLNPVEAIRTL